MKKILKIKKNENGKYMEVLNELSNYKSVCGVWAMYDEKRLLEVAQTADISKELRQNLSYLIKDYSSNLDRRKRYTARTLFKFNCNFDVLKCDKNRRAAKYRNIAENSDEITVYLLDDEQSKSSEKHIREEFELKYAIDNFALYWNAYGKQRKEAKLYYNNSIQKNQ